MSSLTSSSSLVTEMTKFSLERTWTIDGYSIYKLQKEPGFGLQSTEFIDNEHDMKFRILFYPLGTERAPTEFYNYSAACVQSQNITGINWKGEAYIDYTISVEKFQLVYQYYTPPNLQTADFSKFLTVCNLNKYK